ncbi:hypothetical protein GEMRC1_006888 [Eukaryota sp. GEM-RC1]
MLRLSSFNNASDAVWKLAIVVRLIHVLLFLISAYKLDRYDQSSYLSLVQDLPSSLSPLCIRLLQGLSPFCNWDAEHFSYITAYGYTTEQSLAFPPGFLLAIKAGSALVSFLSRLSSPFISSCFVGAVLSNVFQVMATHYFFVLSNLVLGHWNIAFKATLIFILSPVNVFSTAAYSESLFCFVTFFGVISLFSINVQPSRDGVQLVQSKLIPTWSAALLFFCATLIKTFGIFNVVFVFYAILKCPKSERPGFFKSLAFLSCCVLPFLIFQGFAAYNLLKSSTYPFESLQQFYKVYGYIQSKYWNIGKFNFYNIKQLPNFVLASPLIILCVLSPFIVMTCQYLCGNLARNKSKAFTSRHGKKFKIVKENTPSEIIQEVFAFHGLGSFHVISFLFHLLVSFSIIMIFGHVQTIYRLLAFNPLPYWTLSFLMFRSSNSFIVKLFGFLICFLICCLTFFGSVFFSTFNPFT